LGQLTVLYFVHRIRICTVAPLACEAGVVLSAPRVHPVKVLPLRAVQLIRSVPITTCILLEGQPDPSPAITSEVWELLSAPFNVELGPFQIASPQVAMRSRVAWFNPYAPPYAAA